MYSWIMRSHPCSKVACGLDAATPRQPGPQLLLAVWTPPKGLLIDFALLEARYSDSFLKGRDPGRRQLKTSSKSSFATNGFLAHNMPACTVAKLHRRLEPFSAAAAAKANGTAVVCDALGWDGSGGAGTTAYLRWNERLGTSGSEPRFGGLSTWVRL